MNKRYILLLLLTLFSTVASAHQESEQLHTFISTTSLQAVIGASILIALIIAIASLKKNPSKSLKVILFTSICIISISTTFYVAGATIYLNTTSESGGPVHWHTDFEIWKCDERLDLKDPKGLSNRIGTPVFHEHGDQRIHIEGVVSHLDSINLHNFFHVVGGELTSTSLTLPTNDGITTAVNGESCESENAENREPANSASNELQIFLYRITNPSATHKTGFFYTQTKLDNPETYIPAPYSYVPAGDCVIIEYGPKKDKTDKICESYRIARNQGHIQELSSEIEVNNGS